MSSKPKKSEFEASEQEKTSASVSMADKKYFDENYGPLLREMRDLAEKEDFSSVAKGRSSADVYQNLSGAPTLANVSAIDQAADTARAAVSNILTAGAQAEAAEQQRRVGVIGTARGQAADAATGIAKAASIQATKDLQEAKTKMAVRNNRFANFGKVISQAGDNFRQNILLRNAGDDGKGGENPFSLGTGFTGAFKNLLIKPGSFFDKRDYGGGRD